MTDKEHHAFYLMVNEVPLKLLREEARACGEELRLLGQDLKRGARELREWSERVDIETKAACARIHAKALECMPDP